MRSSLLSHHVLSAVFAVLLALSLLSTASAVDMDAGQVEACLEIASAIPSLSTRSTGAWTEANLLRACDNATVVAGILACNSSGFVSSIAFTNAINYANAVLPEAVSRLTALYSFTISGSISGTLPSSWSSLSSLGNLRFESTALTGAIPETWSTLTNLTVFVADFHSNNTQTPTTPPSWFGTRLTALTVIDANFNAFPAGLASSPTMKYLSLINVVCSGCAMPAELATMPAISILQITNNWASAPIDFGGPTSSLPSDFSQSSLSSLYLTGLTLGGQLPSKFNTSTFNTLSAHNLPNIEGPIPQGLIDNPVARVISMSRIPKLSGDVPAPTSPASTKWSSIEISECGLDGTINPMIVNIPTLSTFSLIGLTKLTGTIPEPIGNSTYPCNIEQIYIDNNIGLHGSVPSAYFTKCGQLGGISFNNDSLTGTLPAALANILSPTFYSLSISDNPTSGTIPNIAFPSDLRAGLASIAFSNAGLTGNIPLSLASTTEYTRFQFDGNSLNLCANAAQSLQNTLRTLVASSRCNLSGQTPSECGCPDSWPERCFTDNMPATCPPDVSMPIDPPRAVPSPRAPGAPSKSPTGSASSITLSGLLTIAVTFIALFL